jgi:hypothetical protein
MLSLYSRQQFIVKSLCHILQPLIEWLNPGGSGRDDPHRAHSQGGLALAPDFTPELLHLEAQHLGIDPDSAGTDALLQAIYEAMENQRESKLTETTGALEYPRWTALCLWKMGKMVETNPC